MNNFTVKRFLHKYSTLVIPIIAVGLVQFIQCYNSPSTEEAHPYSDFISNNYDLSNGIVKEDSQDISSDSRTFPKPDKPDNKPQPVIAYHRLLHNVSWAITIPLFTFLLPIANSGEPLRLENQALYGFFSAVIVIIGYAIPILFNGQIPDARSLQNNKITLNHLMHPGHLVNLVGVSFQNQLGIDPMQCLQKTVCEAHRSPQNERYGLLAKPFQYFFPAKNETGKSIHSIYEDAARDGKFTKGDCGKKYECMFDVLELASYFFSMYKRARAKEKGLHNGEEDLFEGKLEL